MIIHTENQFRRQCQHTSGILQFSAPFDLLEYKGRALRGMSLPCLKANLTFTRWALIPTNEAWRPSYCDDNYIWCGAVALSILIVSPRSGLLGIWTLSIAWYSKEQNVSETGSVSVFK
jgi:hypothetical protein